MKHFNRHQRKLNIARCQGNPHASCHKDDLELLSYLQDTTVNCLVKYPLIKNVFNRYNTTLPSSAPVERLFSFAGMVHSPKRTRLSNAHLEQLVLLKSNGYAADNRKDFAFLNFMTLYIL